MSDQPNTLDGDSEIDIAEFERMLADELHRLLPDLFEPITTDPASRAG